MTTQKALLIGVKDLRFVSIRCAQCQTRVVIDMDSVQANARARTGQVIPEKCPSCGATFDSALKHLNAWQDMYVRLKEVRGIQVEIDMGPSEKTAADHSE